jgi:hypothetical protein
VHVEAQISAACLIIEVETAVAEVQVQPWIGGVIDRAENLPIDMGADAKTANIAIGGESEVVAEVAVIAPADERVGSCRPRFAADCDPGVGERFAAR